MRLFTPYKRRKRKDTSDGEGSAPRKLKSSDSNGEDSCDSTNGGKQLHVGLLSGNHMVRPYSDPLKAAMVQML